MHLADQKRWLRTLAYLVNNPTPPPAATEAASLPEDDAEALGGLV